MTTGGRAVDEDVHGVPCAFTAPSLPSTHILRRRRHFQHLVGYLAVHLLLVVVGLAVGMTTDAWSFWPVFVLAGWGVLLDVHAWWAYGGPRTDRLAVR